MQSILQYRKFRRNLRDQIDKHGVAKASGCRSAEDQPDVSIANEASRRQSRETTRSQTEQNDVGSQHELPQQVDEALGQRQVETKDHALKEKDDGSGNTLPQSHGVTANPRSVGRQDINPQKEELGRLDQRPIQESSFSEKDSQHAPFYDLATGSTTPSGLQDPEKQSRRREYSGSTIGHRNDSTSSFSKTSTHDTGAAAPNLETATTRGTTRTALGRTLTGVLVRSRKTNEGGREKGNVFVVDYQGPDDELNPHNWSLTKRCFITFMVASVGFIVGFASSIDSAALQQATKEFGVSEVTESLATGLYLVGFGFGAFFAAPISETVGRNPVYLVTMFLYMVFVMASGLSPNIGAQLVFRFIAGFFGSTPLTCAGGSLSDIWNATERTALFPVFANAAFWGPALGPVIGGFIGQSSLVSWRWVEWVTLIWSGLIWVTLLLFLPETYGPTLLKWKAHHLREITGDERYMSPLEVQDEKFTTRLIHNMYRPFYMFATEPICVLFTLYLTVVYIVLFTFLTGFEFIFTETYGLSQSITFLIFVALGIGFLCASVLVPWVVKSYQRDLTAAQTATNNPNARLAPERRLIFAMVTAPFLPIGLFWMAWTSYPSVSVWSPILSCLPVGFAIMGIFISTYQYLIDSFERYAASALVGATFVRYLAAGGMIPVSIPFYENLGVHWTLTVLGCISALMVPVPYVFWKWGPMIRKRSRHATDFTS